MEAQNHTFTGGSLQISTEALAKIAKCAAMEIEGVVDVSCGTQGKVKDLLEKVSLQTPVNVEMKDGIAALTVNVVVRYGTRIPSIAEKVQENIKGAIQNMTGVAVGRVNLVIAGVVLPQAAAEEE